MVGQRSDVDVAIDGITDLPDDAQAVQNLGLRRARSHIGVEWVMVLLAPLVGFVVYRPERFFLGNTLDPFLYLGYSWDPKDLVARFGMEYYPVRFGLTLPIDLTTRLFGVTGGFFVLRYALALIAIVPLYIYVRAAWSRSIAAMSVVLYLTSPMMLRALMSSYSDTTGLPYLTAAACLLGYTQLPNSRRRWSCMVLAGIFLGLAIHSNPILVVLGAIIGGLWAMAELWERRAGALWEALVVIVGPVVVTIFGVLVYWYRFDYPNFLQPSIDAMTKYSGSDGELFRSPDNAWLAYRFHLYLPPMLVIMWAILTVRQRGERRVSTSEFTMMAILAASSAFFVVHQFVLMSSTLESYYYTSYLTGMIIVGFAIVIGRMTAGSGALARWIVPAVAAALPLIWVAIGHFEFDWSPGLIAVLGAAVVAAVVARTSRRHEAAAIASAIVVLIANQMLLTNAPSSPPFSKGQTFRWDPHYETALGNDESINYSTYELAYQLTKIVPPLTTDEGTLLFWFDSNTPYLPSIQATYRSWIIAWQASLPSMPEITDAQMQRLRDERVRYLVLMASSTEEIDAGRAALEGRGVTIEYRKDSRIATDDLGFDVEVLRISVPSA